MAKREIATIPVTLYPDRMATPAMTTPEADLLAEMRPDRIGARLRLLREALGLKPAEIADQIGAERTYWSRWEGGKRSITEQFAVRLVARYGVTLDFLILGRWDKLPLDLAEAMRRASSNASSSSSD